MARKKKDATAAGTTTAVAERTEQAPPQDAVTIPTPQDVTTGELIRLALSDLVVNPGDNASRYDPTVDPEFPEFKESIRQWGVIQPVLYRLVEKDGNIRPHLAVGFRRVRAVTELNAEYPDEPRYQTVPALELTSTAGLAVLGANWAENAQRKAPTAMDAAHDIQRWSEAGLTGQQIAAVMHRSGGWVTSRKALLELPLRLQAMVHTGDLDADAAYALIRREKDQPGVIAAYVEDLDKPDDAGTAGADGSTEAIPGTENAALPAGDAVGVDTGDGGGSKKGKTKKRKKAKLTRAAARTAKVKKDKATGKTKLVTKSKLPAAAKVKADVARFGTLFAALGRDKELPAEVRTVAQAVSKALGGVPDYERVRQVLGAAVAGPAWVAQRPSTAASKAKKQKKAAGKK